MPKLFVIDGYQISIWSNENEDLYIIGGSSLCLCHIVL